MSDIHAFTAQRQPVALEEHIHTQAEYVPTTLIVPQRFDPGFDPGFGEFEHDYIRDAETQTSLNPQTNPPPKTHSKTHPNLAQPGGDPLVYGSSLNTTPSVNQTALSEAETVFFKPHTTVLHAKAAPPPMPTPHAALHYQAHLRFSDAQGKTVLSQVLHAYPWVHPLPVVVSADAHNPANVTLAWLVASRRQLATAEQFNAFHAWGEQLASAGGAQFSLSDESRARPWDAFLDEAHSLLIGLDSVIVLKVAVPLVQLDLFAQSLIAARFTQSQEHWQYQEHADSNAVFLERLWLAGADAQLDPQQAPVLRGDHVAVQQAVFQLVLDIPHLDAFEARKIYMRFRAVARACAAMIQSPQGAHLSEGMLDRYSRELMMKQEALIQAQVPPGSALAKQVYAPQLRFNADLGLA